MGEAEIDHLRVPAIFQFVVNGNRLSLEPACRPSVFQFSVFQLSQHRCRNLSRWERFGLVGAEGSASNSFHLALAMAMVAF